MSRRWRWWALVAVLTAAACQGRGFTFHHSQEWEVYEGEDINLHLDPSPCCGLTCTPTFRRGVYTYTPTPLPTPCYQPPPPYYPGKKR